MKKYFEFVGVVELILWFIGLIAFIVYIANGGSSHEITTAGVKVTVPALISQGYQWFMIIILLLIYILLGPTIGLLFLKVADMLPEPQERNDAVVSVNSPDDEIKYQKALKLFSLSRYDEAKQLFLELKGYRNSERFASVCDYKSTHSK